MRPANLTFNVHSNSTVYHAKLQSFSLDLTPLSVYQLYPFECLFDGYSCRFYRAEVFLNVITVAVFFFVV